MSRSKRKKPKVNSTKRLITPGIKLCALCKKKAADKDNTHYLTDSIIRKALNEGGNASRSKALSFDVSFHNPFIDLKFQQSTSPDKIEEILQRDITDEDIINSKNDLIFSANKIFCGACENVFTEIETQFTSKLLRKFRNSDLTSVNELVIDDNKLIRLFIYIQLFRTAVSTNVFKISLTELEKIRKIIINHNKTSENIINKLSISLAYLITLGDDIEYTGNQVGYGYAGKIRVIHLNDFIIQFHSGKFPIKYDRMYGVNDQTTYRHFINYDETKFICQVIQNEDRLAIHNSMHTENLYDKLSQYKKAFVGYYTHKNRRFPTQINVENFINEIVLGKTPNNYSKERIVQLVEKYLRL